MILESRRRPELSGPVQHLHESYIAALSAGLQRIGFGGQDGTAQAAFAALDGLVLQLLADVNANGVEAASRSQPGFVTAGCRSQGWRNSRGSVSSTPPLSMRPGSADRSR